METSTLLYKQSCELIPGGVNSPVRAFKGAHGTPLFIKSGKGAYITDVDDKTYIDYVGSWGPMILGHAHADVIQAVIHQCASGLSFGAPTELELLLAKKIQDFMPNMNWVRMVNSGTEATMSAIRLARGFTKRDKFLKFTGCYHGHSDSLLVEAGSGVLTCGIPSSSGVPASVTANTLVAEYNNLEQVKHIFKAHGNDIAAIIVEPVAGNMNCVLPLPGFLQGLRDICDQYESLLIFDEVMTGFRVAKGGAQALYHIKPDLITLGKIIGGGLPVGAFGGREDIMNSLAPLGSVYQAGTLSGNPIAMAAGLATLTALEKPDFYAALTAKTEYLISGLKEVAKAHHIPFSTNYVCGMFGLFFNENPHITDYKTVMKSDVNRFKAFHYGLLQEGVYLAPSAFEAGFVSIAHTEADLAKTIAAADKVMETLK